MAIDLCEIEAMLGTLAKQQSATIGKLILELQAEGEPETREEVEARDSLIARIQGRQRDLERGEAQLLEVRRELFGTSEETFTGPWPPTDPANLSAQWVALADDVDELPEDYLGEGHFDEGSPLFAAWYELDARMNALDPHDIDHAHALLSAAERDWVKTGSNGFWDGRVLETARAVGRAGERPG